MTKLRIPQKLREEVWIQSMGLKYSGPCMTPWCTSCISVFDFHVAHKVAESKGGSTTLDNLIPLCAKCNLSMGTKSFEEWISFGPKMSFMKKVFCCTSKGPNKNEGPNKNYPNKN